jgi:hypothetical protein
VTVELLLNCNICSKSHSFRNIEDWRSVPRESTRNFSQNMWILERCRTNPGIRIWGSLRRFVPASRIIARILGSSVSPWLPQGQMFHLQRYRSRILHRRYLRRILCQMNSSSALIFSAILLQALEAQKNGEGCRDGIKN